MWGEALSARLDVETLTGLPPAALDELPLLVSYIDRDLRYRFMNRAYEAWFGHRREEMLGRSMPEVLGAAAWKVLEERVRLVQSGQPVRFETRAPYRDSGPRDVVAHYSPAGDGGFYAVVEDVSEVRRVERRAQQILEGLPDPFISLDRDLNLTFANPAACGFLPDGALNTGGSLKALLTPEREAMLRQVLDSGEPVEIETRSAVRPDRTVLLRVFPLDDGLGVHGRDVTEARKAEHELADRELRLAAAAEAVRGVAYDWDIESDTVVRSSGLKQLVGVAPEEADPRADWWRARIHPDDIARIEAAKGPFLSVDWSEAEYRVRHADGRWVDVLDRAQVLFDATGRAVRVIGTTIDITAIKQGEARLRILIDEVNHRVKNTLATVQALAHLAARTSGDKDDFLGRFEDRLGSLSRAHDLLTQRHWKDATLREVVDNALAPFDVGRARIAGPPVVLRPRHALALSLALHELATNAAKHGAFSTPDGRLDLTWSTDGPVVVAWREHDGPPVREPLETGFGSRLLKAMARDLAGEIKVDFAPDGVRCRIAFRP